MPEKVFRENFRLIRSFFHRCFQTLGDLLSEIWQTFVQQAVKHALHLSRRFWWRKARSLRRKDDCVTVLEFLDILPKNLAELSKLHSTWPEEFLEAKQFFQQDCVFFVFAVFVVNVPRDFGENFGQVCQSCFIHVDGKFLWKSQTV